MPQIPDRKLKIQTGTPTKVGVYVVFADSELGSPFTDRKIMMWHEGRWHYPGSDQRYRCKIHGWIGPLPIMKLTAESENANSEKKV